MVIDDVAEFLEKKRWTIDWPSKRKKVDYRLTHQHIYIYIYYFFLYSPWNDPVKEWASQFQKQLTMMELVEQEVLQQQMGEAQRKKRGADKAQHRARLL